MKKLLQKFLSLFAQTQADKWTKVKTLEFKVRDIYKKKHDSNN
jgi:hypothetical protein